VALGLRDSGYCTVELRLDLTPLSALIFNYKLVNKLVLMEDGMNCLALGDSSPAGPGIGCDLSIMF